MIQEFMKCESDGCNNFFEVAAEEIRYDIVVAYCDCCCQEMYADALSNGDFEV